jgi:hypothetical protein
MSAEDPHDDPEKVPSEPPPSGGGAGGGATFRERAQESVRSRLESVIPEILKRVVEIGVEKARESPADVKQFVQDMKVPKEIAQYLFHQIDETKNGMFRVVAKEMRDFLEHTNFSGEVQKLLTTVQFEVNTTIRFTPNDGREPRDGKKSDSPADEEGPASSKGDREGTEPLPRPEIKTSVRVSRGQPEPRHRRSRSGT